MKETFVSNITLPGAVVQVDPHLEALLAINLLDDEPAPPARPFEPPRFPHSAGAADERILVLSR